MQKQMINNMEREYGVDLLRVVAMFMVVVLHVLGGGGILDNTEEMSLNYCGAWLLEIAAYAAVNCYALISGYIGIQTKRKWVSLIMLWLQVAFYSCLSTVIFSVVKSDGVTIKQIVKSLLPTIFETYWYFTAYVGMWLFIPVMNVAVESLSKKKLMLTLLVAITVLYPVSVFTDAFYVRGGYCVGWLMYLYIVGACLQKYNILQRYSHKKWLLAYIMSVAITMVSKVCIVLLRGSSGNLLVNYVSPTIVFCAIALLGAFSNLPFGEGRIRFIRVISPHAFGIYLIHNHPLTFEYTMRGRFSWLAEEQSVTMISAVILVSIVICLVCGLVDFIRSKMFKLLKIKVAVIWFVNRVENIVDELWKRFETSLQA